MKLSTLKRMNELEDLIIEITELSRPISVVSLVKYSKQAFYNGNPKYYQLPTSQENSFILSYVKNSSSNVDLLKNFVDSTGQYARITTFMKDIGTDKMERIEENLKAKIKKIFPEDQYEITITGKAYLFQKGTKYLIVPSHSKKSGIPLLIVMREVLKLVNTRKELKKILLENKVLVNNKPIREENYSLVLFDTLTRQDISNGVSCSIIFASSTSSHSSSLQTY